MAKKGVYVAFLDVKKHALAMSVMEGKPIPDDYRWGKHVQIRSGSAIVHVFYRGESISVPEIQGMIDKWERGGFRQILNQK